MSGSSKLELLMEATEAARLEDSSAEPSSSREPEHRIVVLSSL